MAKLYFRYGTMDSAKSMNLLAVAHNYRKQGKKVLLVKPRLDTRFGASKISSRCGLEADADLMIDEDTTLDPRDFVGLDCVLVDEAQFLPPHVIDDLRRITVDPGVPVICYGLRTDFQGELFPGKAPGPQFYPVSAIDYLTGYLMACGAMVALARRTREGGSWLVRISLAQTGRWLVSRGEVPVAQLKAVPKEFTAEELSRWSITSETPVGRLQHLGPALQLSETAPRWARPTVPLGYHSPEWPAR